VVTRRMPDTWIACSIRCEVADVERQIEEMEARLRQLREHAERLRKLADMTDQSGEFAAI
jgi:hypothetical protein